MGFHVYIIWATASQNQQNDFAHSKDSDQPGHQPSLIWVFAVPLKDSQGPNASSDSDQTG